MCMTLQCTYTDGAIRKYHTHRLDSQCNMTYRVARKYTIRGADEGWLGEVQGSRTLVVINICICQCVRMS